MTGCTVVKTEGALTNCAHNLADEQLPSDNASDPTMEPGAPEMPAVPPQMP